MCKVVASADKIVISFFINARGNDLEQSSLGAYRSLLFQLLDRIPALRYVFNSLGLSTTTVRHDYHWSIETLKVLLRQAIESLSDISVVISWMRSTNATEGKSGI
jgi:hypothetical protein